MANNISYSNFLGGYTLSTVEQSDGSHAIQLVEITPGVTQSLIGTDLFSNKFPQAQLQTDNSYALNIVLISF